MGGEMVFFINYVEVGRFAENDFFSGGVAYYGLNAAPGDQLILHKFTIEVPTGNVGNVKVVSFFDPGIQPAAGDTLQSLAAQHNLLFGTFMELWNFIPEQPYAEIAVNQFSLWETIRLVAMPQSPDTYDFCMGDMFVDLASRYEKPIHVKDVIWHGRIPDWLLRPGSDPAEWANMIGDPVQFEAVVKDYVQTIVSRYQGKIYAYDVVAEAIGDPGTTTVLAPEPLRDSPWLVGLGPDYIDKAFRWVDEVDPDALLFYNDYNAEGLGEKSDHVYELVSGLLERGVPIDGVGFQMHFWDLVSHPSPEDVAANMKRLTDLGLLVTITEMDVVIHNSSGTPEDKLQQQAEWYAAILRVCMENPGCIGFGTWGFTDKHSWLYSPEPNSYSNQGPLLFDTDYQPKPAYDELMDTLKP
jgi:endo-1,4-beta-xylanase